MSISKSSSILFSTILLLISCHTSQEQKVNATPPNMPQDVYKSLTLPFTDTNSPQGKALIYDLDTFYKRQIAAGFNGSVLIGYKGNVIYERYYGTANRSTSLPLSRNTASQLASTSKPFTAVGILLLHQNGYLNINDPVQKHLKEFPYESITIKQLLNHRSGLQDYVKMGLTYWNDRNKTMYNEDLLQIFSKFKPALQFTPGSRFRYCNSNYAFLARIIEEVSEISYSKFMKQFIFDPIGMTNTFVYDPNEPMPANRAISYKANWAIDGDMYADGVYGDKGIYSTPQDMYKWDQSFYHHKILNPTTLELSYLGYSPEIKENKNYGLGWRMINGQNDYKIIFHNGWWHGNNTVFYRFIKDNLTIIILGNKYNSKIYHQVKPIYRIIARNANIPINESMLGEEEE